MQNMTKCFRTGPHGRTPLAQTTVFHVNVVHFLSPSSKTTVFSNIAKIIKKRKSNEKRIRFPQRFWIQELRRCDFGQRCAPCGVAEFNKLPPLAYIWLIRDFFWFLRLTNFVHFTVQKSLDSDLFFSIVRPPPLSDPPLLQDSSEGLVPLSLGNGWTFIENQMDGRPVCQGMSFVSSGACPSEPWQLLQISSKAPWKGGQLLS